MVLADKAQLTDFHKALWVFDLLSAPLLVIIFLVTQGLGTFKNARRGLLSFSLSAFLVVISVFWQFYGMAIMDPDSNSVLAYLTYRSTLGAPFLFFACACSFSYFFSYLLWVIEKIFDR